MKSLLDHVKDPFHSLKNKQDDHEQDEAAQKQAAVERKEHDREERERRREIEQCHKAREFQLEYEKDPVRGRYGPVPHTGDEINIGWSSCLDISKKLIQSRS